MVREYERLQVVEDQIKAWEKEKKERLKNPDTVSLQKVAKLASLYGIGSVSSWTFVMEFFGWRQFQNRREVGALAGLTPTPYDSGKSLREQGISKAGNQRVRALAVEIAWGWLRFGLKYVFPVSNVSVAEPLPGDDFRLVEFGGPDHPVACPWEEYGPVWEGRRYVICARRT